MPDPYTAGQSGAKVLLFQALGLVSGGRILDGRTWDEFPLATGKRQQTTLAM